MSSRGVHVHACVLTPITISTGNEINATKAQGGSRKVSPLPRVTAEHVQP